MVRDFRKVSLWDLSWVHRLIGGWQYSGKTLRAGKFQSTDVDIGQDAADDARMIFTASTYNTPAKLIILLPAKLVILLCGKFSFYSLA
jgi:hypothetical protein